LTALAGIGGEEPAAADTGAPKPSPAKLASRTYDNVLRLQASISAVADCTKPVIAVVHGYCIGGGIDLISACDIRICSADARFSVRETKMAIVADLGTLQRLPQVLPMGQVAELVYTGKDIDAGRAERIGLVNEVHLDSDSALAAGRALAAEIAANSPFAVQGAKAVLAQIHRRQVEDGLRFVAAWNAGHLRSHDLTEAVSAFMEKRSANFEGR
jgi:enoyl-CoA hydratase